MKTLKYILGIITFIGFGNVLFGQSPSISSILPNTVCKGGIVTITGSNMRIDTLTLRDGGTRINFSANIISSSSTQIVVQIPASLTRDGSLRFIVYKNGDNTSNDEETFSVTNLPEISLAIDNGGSANVCPSFNSRDLKFNVSGNSGGDDILITYSINGVTHQTAVTGNSDFDTTVILTTSTIYSVIAIQNLDTGCDFYPTNETVIFNVAPMITGTLSTSDNELCEGESTSIIFSFNNPNNDNMKVYYKKNNGTTIDTTVTTSLITLTESPTSTTTYELTKIENLTQSCEKIFTTNNEQTVTVRKTPATTMSLLTPLAICSGEEIQLRLENNTTSNDFIKIFYTKGGLANSLVIENDTTIKFPTTLTSTIFTLTGVELANHGCYKNLTNAPIIVTVASTITGTLTVSDNVICNGDSVSLFFTGNNPNSDNLTFHYSDGTNSLTAMTTGTFVAVPSGALSATTTFTLDSIENTTTSCTKIITNSEVITVYEAPVTAMSLITANQICYGEEIQLTLTNNTAGGDSIRIFYTKNGSAESIVIKNDLTIQFLNTLTTTTFTLTGVELAKDGCFKNLTNAPITVTVAPNITGSLSASTNTICNGESVTLFFTANNPNGDNLTFHYSDGTNSLTATTTGTFVSVPSGALSVTTTFTLDSIENTTTSCTKIITNDTATIAVNNTMDVRMISSVTSLCSGNNYDLIFKIEGSEVNENIKILYSQDGVTLQLDINTGITNSDTIISVPVAGTITHLFSLVSVTNLTTGCFTSYTPNSSNTIEVTVTPSISASISASSTVLCEGSSTNLIFSVANPNASPVVMYYKDNLGNLFNDTTDNNSKVVPVLSLLNTTTYTLDSVKINGCTFPFSDFVTITVNKVPDVKIYLTGNGISCNGASAQLTFKIDNKNNPNDSVKIQYLEGSTLRSFKTTNTIHTIAVAPPTTTVYSLVSITDTTTNCSNFNVSSSDSSNVTVTAGNNLTGELQVSTNEVCEGQNVNLNFIINGASGNTNLIYTVDGVAAPTLLVTGSTANVTSSSLNNTTTFKLISLTAVSTGCPGDTISGSSTKNVSVNTLPNTILTTVNGSNTTAICNGQSTDLKFTVTDGTPPFSLIYVETVSGFNTNSTFNTASTTLPISPTQPISTYNISSISDSKGCSDATPTGAVTVTVNPLPTAILNISNADIVLCKGETADLNFTVGNNNNHDVKIGYKSTTDNGIITHDSITTTNGNNTTINVVPDSTTTYEITYIENIITDCIGTPTGNSKTITVNAIPEGSVTININTVCNGDNALFEFNFTSGVSPFTVLYDSTSTNIFNNSTQSNTLTFGSLLNQKQNNASSLILANTYFITKITDGNNCVNDYVITGNHPTALVNINPTPDVTLTGVQPASQPYASTDASIYTLSGIPSGGNVIGAGVGITTIFNGLTTANFIPANAGFPVDSQSLSIDLIYNLTDPTTFCIGSDTVPAILKKALDYNFFNDGTTTLDTQYCRNTDSLYIYATVDNNGAVGAIGGNQFVLNNNVFSNPQTIGDSARVTLIPFQGSGTYSLRFGSVESGFINRQITIVDTINTSFSPFIDGAFFCQDFADSIRLIGIPTLDVDSSSGIFSSPTVGLITSNTSNSVDRGWYLQQAISGEHRIIYTYIDVTSCVTTATQAIRITPTPIAHFVSAIDCNNKVATFNDNSIFTANTNGLDSIVTWNWQFGDGTDSIRLDSLPFDYSYDASGIFNATLNVVSALGCTNTFDTTVIVGVRPSMDFSWRFATLGENTELVNLSTANLGGTLIDNVNNLTWNFGDGTPDSTTTLDTTLHLYGNTGVFQVGLTAETDNGCVSDTTFNIFILPKIDTYPYYERFNSSDGEWIANPIAGNVWEWADSLVYNNSNRGWTTDSASTYPLGRDIFVFSPIFDFTTIEKPLITFKYRVNSRVSDGAVLQHSTDDGQTWSALGDLTSGLAWYDVDNLVAQPGKQTGFVSFGWSGNSDTDWKVARHKLDLLKGEPKVRFRFAFASVAGDTSIYDGFAFDDFFIGERQKRVIIENFTNVGTPNYSLIQDTIYQRLNDNDLDIAMVEYHNGLPANDNFNIFNPADPSGRSLYYQFSQTGKTVIDGKIYNSVTANTTNFEWSQLDLDLAMLEEPEFNVAIDNFNINNGTLDITTTIKARKPLNATTRKVYIAVVEDDLTLSNRTHKSILRKLLPSSAGTSLTNSWAIGTAQTVTQSWTFNPNEIDATKLNVVVWIQDNNTKKIYQSTSSALPNIAFDSTVVNTKTPLDNTESMVFNLFPNPNKGNFTIIFSSPINTETNWQLVDISGRTVHQGQIAANQERVNITTNDLPKGMYFFRMYNEEGASAVRKVLVE